MPCRSISGESDLIKMLLKSSFNMTMHGNTHILKHMKQSQNLDGLFFPTHHTAHILLPQIFTSLEPSRMPSVGEHLGVMTRLLKKWLRVQNSNWHKKGTDVLVSPWHKAAELDENYVEK
jgi:hypothetical protein